MPLPTIVEDAFVLRPLEISDVEALHALWCEPEVCEHWHLPPPTTLDVSRRRLQEMLAEQGAPWLWAIVVDDQTVGHVGWMSTAQGQRCPFGYALSPRCWGRGITTRAAERALLYGVEHGLAGAELWIYEGNVASVRVAQKLGATFKGRFVALNPSRGQTFETLVYGVTARELGVRDGVEPVAFYGVQPTLPTHSVQEQLDFYCGRLGFRLDWSVGSPPVAASVSRMDWQPVGAIIRFAQSDATCAAFKGLLNIGVCDVDRLAEELQAKGVAIAAGPIDRPWGLRELDVVDPSGMRLRFESPVHSDSSGG